MFSLELPFCVIIINIYELRITLNAFIKESIINVYLCLGLCLKIHVSRVGGSLNNHNNLIRLKNVQLATFLVGEVTEISVINIILMIYPRERKGKQR